MKLIYKNKQIKEIKNTRFLGLAIGSSLSWRDHIDYFIFKLGRAWYAIRYVKPFVSKDTLETIYLTYFYSILSYGIIFWGNSAFSCNIFKIQKGWLE